MEASELRLGNWVYKDYLFGWQEIRVTPAVISNLFNEEKPSLYCIKEINLTKEWLLKFGFEWDIYWQGYTDGNWVITEGAESGMWRMAYGKRRHDIISYQIKYVHQLQNLYFALTGHELWLVDDKKDDKR